jgi:hypothetical protein
MMGDFVEELHGGYVGYISLSVTKHFDFYLRYLNFFDHVIQQFQSSWSYIRPALRLHP